MKFDSASVKVMRSYDYCHFEVSLSGDGPWDSAGVDALRKEAARLADKAVEQYKIAKMNAELCERSENELAGLRYRHREVLKKPESERTPEEKAVIKAIDDRAHRLSRDRYDYEDDWDEPEYPEDDDDQVF